MAGAERRRGYAATVQGNPVPAVARAEPAAQLARAAAAGPGFRRVAGPAGGEVCYAVNAPIAAAAHAVSVHNPSRAARARGVSTGAGPSGVIGRPPFSTSAVTGR